jgi:hypothetical protein
MSMSINIRYNINYQLHTYNTNIKKNIYGEDTYILMNRLNTWRRGILDLSDLNIIHIPWLPYRLKKLNCSNTKITSLRLPIDLEWLNCSNTQITSLNIPISLEWLDCSNTPISNLNITNNLEYLNYSNTNIKSLNFIENKYIKENNNIFDLSF